MYLPTDDNSDPLEPIKELVATTNQGLSIDQVPLMGKEGVGKLWFEMEAEERLEKLLIAIS